MTKKVDKFANSTDWDNWIGKQIIKYSGKPFKSGAKIGIVDSIGVNPNSGKKCFIMREDQTSVDCFQCNLLNK